MAFEDERLATQLAEKGIRDRRVLDAMARVPRARFVAESEKAESGIDVALPIGHGQTISQPYVVAYMTQALGVQPGQRILEIGTGSGYQTAVLLELGAEVFSIERIASLAAESRARLASLGYTGPRLHLRCADGTEGWPEAAPFDAVLVAAAADRVPPALLSQLGPEGRLIAPVGETDESQRLVLVERERGEWNAQGLIGVRFVPLIADEARPELLH